MARARTWGTTDRPKRRSTVTAVLATLAGVAGVVVMGVAAAVPAATGTGAVTSPVPGQLTGNVVVRGAPAGFLGEVGVLACPVTAAPATAATDAAVCAQPQFAISGSGGSYTLGLPAGTWEVTGFYQSDFGSGGFLGYGRSVTVTAGATTRQNLSIPYQEPGGVGGTVTVTHVPGSVSIEEEVVTACPASEPIVGGTPSILCATDYLTPGTTTYALPSLSEGQWLLYVGYYTDFGLTQGATATTVTIRKGVTSTQDLSLAYRRPTNAIVEGTVTVTGAPSGFSALIGVGGCPSTGGRPTLCADPQYTLSGPGGQYELVLPAGSWNIAGFYEIAPFGGQFLSELQHVRLTEGGVLDLDITVPYVAPATVSSAVSVTGVPPGTTLEATELVACPASSPYTGGSAVPIECVTGSSAPGTPVVIDTLPPGHWLLYPGYVTGSVGVVGTTGTPVKLVSGGTTHHALSIAYGSA